MDLTPTISMKRKLKPGSPIARIAGLLTEWNRQHHSSQARKRQALQLFQDPLVVSDEDIVAAALASQDNATEQMEDGNV